MPPKKLYWKDEDLSRMLNEAPSEYSESNDTESDDVIEPVSTAKTLMRKLVEKRLKRK